MIWLMTLMLGASDLEKVVSDSQDAHSSNFFYVIYFH